MQLAYRWTDNITLLVFNLRLEKRKTSVKMNLIKNNNSNKKWKRKCY